MSFSIGLSKTSFNSELVVHFMRQQGGWSLFAGGLALIQVVFTAGVITDILLRMFEPTLLKLGFSSAKIWMSLLGVGSVGAFFLESVMFFFIINAKGSAATNMAFITGGIGLFSKLEGSFSLDAYAYGIFTAITPYNVYLTLLVVGTIYSIKVIADMFTELHDTVQQSKVLDEAVKDKLVELEVKQINKIR